MIDYLLSYIAPHLCSGCGKIGTVLCDNCKYDITSEAFTSCISCLHPTASDNCCLDCRQLYQRAWCVGVRAGVLQRLIGNLKFQNVRAAYRPLADMLADKIDQLPASTVVVPLPTVPSHVRERGYDHTRLIARRLARSRGWRLQAVLLRRTATKQRGSSYKDRQTQASAAFYVPVTLDPAVPYLLVDDVMTTGASIEYGVQALRRAGAEIVMVAIIARQILD